VYQDRWLHVFVSCWTFLCHVCVCVCLEHFYAYCIGLFDVVSLIMHHMYVRILTCIYFLSPSVRACETDTGITPYVCCAVSLAMPHYVCSTTVNLALYVCCQFGHVCMLLVWPCMYAVSLVLYACSQFGPVCMLSVWPCMHAVSLALYAVLSVWQIPHYVCTCPCHLFLYPRRMHACACSDADS
jgi:hypothetical protein